jgi:hypothetical protein
VTGYHFPNFAEDSAFKHSACRNWGNDNRSPFFPNETSNPLGLDRGRENRLLGPPSLRTVQADLPHTALRLVVHLIKD